MGLAKWSALPILDISRLEAGSSQREAFLQELRETALGLGFFYLKGHGINENLTQQVLNISRRFFDLAEAEKLSIEMVNSPHFRGYNRSY